MLLGKVVFKYSAPMVINVFAGNDRTMCLNQNLLMTELAALPSDTNMPKPIRYPMFPALMTNYWDFIS